MKDPATVSYVMRLFEATREFVGRFDPGSGRRAEREIRIRFQALTRRFEKMRPLLSSGEMGGDAGEFTVAAVDGAAATGRFLPLLVESLQELGEIRRIAERGSVPGAGELDRAFDDAPPVVEETTLILSGASGRPVALVSVLKGRANLEQVALRDGQDLCIGSGKGTGIRFDSQGEPVAEVRISCREGDVFLEVDSPRWPVYVNSEIAGCTPIYHADVVRLGREAWVQLLVPSAPEEARVSTGRAVRGLPALADSNPEMPAVAGCAGACGAFLGLEDIKANRAILVSEGTYCLSCIREGKGAFFRVDDYIILRLIGRGGMGEVYLAMEASSGEFFALKILRAAIESDPESLVRFHREVKMLSLLDHPNIVRFIGSGRIDDGPYLVMEYVPGKKLTEVIPRAGRLDGLVALQIAYQVTKALEHAHSRGIVHRDLKPDNIIIDREKRVRVLDMGLAKPIRTEGSSLLTERHTTMGTLRYASPEQVEDACFADHRSDVYSLGATLYHMVVGAPPFDGVSNVAMMNRITSGPFPCPTDLVPDLASEVARLIARSTALAREDRFQSATEMGAALRDAIDALSR